MVSTGRERSLANLRPFQKGQSGNVHGRRKQLDALVSRQTKNGAELVAFFADVFYARGQFEHARVPLAMRMEAGTWLADRLWGKPKQSVDVGGELTQRHELTVEVRPVDYRASIRTLRPPAEDDERSLPA